MLALVLFAAWNVVDAAAQNKDIQKELDALYKKHGKRPNKIHFMWDDNSFGEIGIPTVNKICGFDTPRLNKTGQEEITFTRMYTESSCTPTWAAALTGRLAVRNRNIHFLALNFRWM